MNHPSELENAIGQLFDVPVTYNPMVAKALRSTKAAILLDYLVDRESCGDSTLSHADIAHDTGLGLTEAKTALSILEEANVITKTKARMNKLNYAVNPFFMNDLLGRLEQHKDIEGHLPFDLMNPIAINRLHMQTLKSLGASANASIILSFLLGHLSDKDRLEHPDLTDWFESNDKIWLGMTGMSEKELRNAKKSLVALGFVERKHIGMPSKLHLRLNMKKLADCTWMFAGQQKSVKQTMFEPTNVIRAYA